MKVYHDVASAAVSMEILIRKEKIVICINQPKYVCRVIRLVKYNVQMILVFVDEGELRP